MAIAVIEMPYIGDVLSCNRKHSHGRVHPRAKQWREELADNVRKCNIPPSSLYMISVRGRFVDNRRPDISNLFKIISDAVQDGLGVNDKYFRLHDDGYATGFENPYLVIRVATWEVSYGQSELE